MRLRCTVIWQGAYRVRLGCIQAAYKGHLGYTKGAFWVHIGCV